MTRKTSNANTTCYEFNATNKLKTREKKRRDSWYSISNYGKKTQTKGKTRRIMKKMSYREKVFNEWVEDCDMVCV